MPLIQAHRKTMSLDKNDDLKMTCQRQDRSRHDILAYTRKTMRR